MKRLVFSLLALMLPLAAHARPTVTIGSKNFVESWIIGDALAQLARGTGKVDVEHRKNLGGTQVLYQALARGDIDIYLEYTGTITQTIMKAKGRPSRDAMRHYLEKQGLGMSEPLGFDNSYALAVPAKVQEKYGLTKISDLAQHPNLRLVFSHEFMGRTDGWPGLSRAYGLRMNSVRGIQHELAYGALASGQADVTDVYTTDPQIERLNLTVLEDDRHFLPVYDAVLLYRLNLPNRAPEAFAAMQQLEGMVSQEEMIHTNSLVVMDKETSQEAAHALLQKVLGGSDVAFQRPSIWRRMLRNTLVHLELVGISLLAAILVGVPLGILATRSRTLAGVTLSGAGLLQTIPSLALLALLVPPFGVGAKPALIALFLYSLLPIVQNTYTGLTTVPPNLLEAASVIGLSPVAQLVRVRLPLASPSIMAGIKTSAIINVGTATLAALVGAGGLGAPILQGISLRDNNLILQGAVPAAVLALIVQWLFTGLDRVAIPRGLRLRSHARA